MQPELVQALEEHLGLGVKFSASAPGSSFHQTRIVVLEDGRRAFVKSNPKPLPGAFQTEAQGLEALARARALRIPEVLAVDESFLAIEWIELGIQQDGFWEKFGRSLADLHRRTRGPRCGFVSDNYLGATRQPNGMLDDWSEFWRLRRLGHQLELARANGLSDPELDRLGDLLMDRLEDWLAEPYESAVLLHGDLWSGNFLVDSVGSPVLIDPAVYHGRREADLAMTRLFGGFSESFYQAYEEVWPLEPGWPERLEIYKLYHLLNHLNLFGTSYRGTCLGILRNLVG